MTHKVATKNDLQAVHIECPDVAYHGCVRGGSHCERKRVGFGPAGGSPVKFYQHRQCEAVADVCGGGRRQANQRFHAELKTPSG